MMTAAIEVNDLTKCFSLKSSFNPLSILPFSSLFPLSRIKNWRIRRSGGGCGDSSDGSDSSANRGKDGCDSKGSSKGVGRGVGKGGRGGEKASRTVVAVDHISFTVKEGEIFALLGPNGAGKTTTLKILTTLLKPTSGYARVAGFDVVSERSEVRKRTGIVFQDSALDLRLTGRENLDFHARMYGLSSAERKRRVDEALNLVGLEEYADVITAKYSGGMRRRLEIARGFVHHPDVLFLDEPTLGLDVHTRRKIWSFIKMLNKEENITIMLTTHYIEEADFLCSRVGIMQKGRIVAIDSPENLKNMLRTDILTLSFSGNAANVRNALEDLCEILSKLKYVRDLSVKGECSIMLKVERADLHITEILEVARRMGLNVNAVNLRKPSLEDAFIELTGMENAIEMDSSAF